jgi:hypothetical protein
LHEQAAHTTGGSRHKYAVIPTDRGGTYEPEGGAPICQQGHRLTDRETIGYRNQIIEPNDDPVGVTAEAAGRCDDMTTELRRVDVDRRASASR